VRVVIVSGIWPPDVGGPASHAQALAGWLQRHGHAPAVVMTAASAPAPASYPVRWVSRRAPRGVRHALVISAIARQARSCDVVYATSMVRRAAAGARLARRPLVVKLVSDEVYERARRAEVFAGSIDEFQRFDGGGRIHALRRSRGAALRRAAHVLCPSSYLRDIALGWGLDPSRVSVLPNPAPALPELPSRADARATLRLDGPAFAFAGRLTRQKALGVALAAIAELPTATLLLLGDGPERKALAEQARQLDVDGRVRFLGAGTREDALRLFRGADAVVLSSDWENLPHTIVEALAVGTPVIATEVGGVPEIVRDGENGLLVPPASPGALVAALRRFLDDANLRERLTASAAPSVAHLAEDVVFERIERHLMEALAS
jgi:glycosyltransferase involved in cell wall biosynthesis